MGWEPDAFGATASGLRHLPTFVALGKVYYRPKFAVICFRTASVARDMNGFFLGTGKTGNGNGNAKSQSQALAVI